jgi:hypothetical protein
VRKVACGTIAAIALAGIGACLAPPFANADAQAPSTSDLKLPAGYRDWPLISLARVGGPVNDLRAKLGNPIAMKAYREGTRPFPDGTIIARLAYTAVTSEENNKVFRAAA